MNEEEVKEAFGSDYKPAEPINEWEQWVEIRLSRQGQILIGLGVGVLATLLLTTAQGKIVINLVKGHKAVVETLNAIVEGGAVGQVEQPKYSKPSGRIDEARIEPADEEELAQLRARLENSGEEPGVM
jgi:hypothetical protein